MTEICNMCKRWAIPELIMTCTDKKCHYKGQAIPITEEDYKQIMGHTSDGSTASYYELPPNATELQHLISHKNMNAQIGEIFRAAYRYGESSHSDQIRDAKKIQFYINAELERLEK